ncbi:MAG: FHA domain-containing protein [Gammaproteobacteria bacterium]|nr:FHA domain-containing protein [Gammaproteobacteria bacterium]MBT8111647.1 FHA domain-containing protein [Gammaproteobacteria bacterium]NND47823.1 FHA domain-containing protein [Woeseiaceae bacterium]NNL46345.1 FHA domain-containing protein [Woeseiaceae bacterium]
MANENKNINELVSNDDDPTSELEVLNFQRFDVDDVELESDSNTYGFGNNDDASSSGQSIPELRSDLERRTQTIGRLQYDIEQLRAKWLGLETEIEAREEIVTNLLRDVDGLKTEVSRKDKLLKKRTKTIKSLKSDIKQRDETQALLEQQHVEVQQQLDAQRSTDADNVSALDDASRELEKMHTGLKTAQDEIESLKSEIGARDETNGLLEQQQAELEERLDHNVAALAKNKRELAQANSQLEAAQQKIASLTSEKGQQGEVQGLLEHERTELERQLAERTASLEEKELELEKMHSTLLTVESQSAAELIRTQQTSSTAIKDAKAQLAGAEKYADTLRYKLQDLIESQSQRSRERDRLNETLEQVSERNWQLSEDLEAAGASIIELQAALKQQHDDHEQEIRTLRFELGEAQSTATQTGELNCELTTDLLEARSFKQELERMLHENDESAQGRLKDLEKQLSGLSETIEDLEQKLETKSNTINVLLGELAKKSEQIDSIGEIENVIQEIDNRMSERFDDRDMNQNSKADLAQESADRDRVTRVLIGSFGSQELRFPLFKDRLTIGRNEDNDIKLKTTYISRRHAVIVTEGDATRVIDWGSKNGVFVNSDRVKEQILSNGDIVAIGNVKFRYEERPKREA